jgi:predicted site-specific integrase-resolvase
MIDSLFEYAGQMSFRSVLAEIASGIAFGRRTKNLTAFLLLI